MLPILLALAFIAILFIVVIAGQSTDFSIARSATMSVSPEEIFPHVNDLHKWNAWSPWAKLDPKSQSIFEGPVSGTGSVMTWTGNNKVGEGKMTITESQPSKSIRLRLDFQKPMKATNIVEFTFSPEGSGTMVVWKMAGKNNCAGKIFGLFVNCEKLVGRQFEKGLATLKSLVEIAA